jgi:RNase_H superfamily
MITVSSLADPDCAPQTRAGHCLAAAVDVEWTKNYKIKNGNQPFCCSVVYLDLPGSGPADLSAAAFEYVSVYLEPGEPAPDLAARADTLIRAVLRDARIVTGHQVCADLAVLSRTAGIGGIPAQSVTEARTAWHQRRLHAQRAQQQVIDTRYDIGHLLHGTSRRLVDVATELGLDVTQPELRGTSMTALHRTWLDTGDSTARERISVLNLRHSLSTALLALHAAGLGDWKGVLNVNQLIADQAAGAWLWLDSAPFRDTFKEPNARP